MFYYSFASTNLTQLYFEQVFIIELYAISLFHILATLQISIIRLCDIYT